MGLLKTEDDQTIADLVALNIGQIGENMAFGDADVFHSKSGLFFILSNSSIRRGFRIFIKNLVVTHFFC